MRRIVTLALGAFALVGLLAGPANAAPAKPADVVPLGCLMFGIGCPPGFASTAN
ncbi:hypothetical protein AB0L35_10795 [Streptomyces sp. NPDC052309]|uniref:Secreted protein n=1 Tax=Streptomyces griseicoloratus TaxID=2752516 RepID=A0A926L3C4_9ACTN|nr:hypothetical protein [Streptomyces griseicoloratus]MBD0420334.1 hypothetical protein [Streptomyces griseicoloratus]